MMYKERRRIVVRKAGPSFEANSRFFEYLCRVDAIKKRNVWTRFGNCREVSTEEFEKRAAEADSKISREIVVSLGRMIKCGRRRRHGKKRRMSEGDRQCRLPRRFVLNKKMARTHRCTFEFPRSHRLLLSNRVIIKMIKAIGLSFGWWME